MIVRNAPLDAIEHAAKETGVALYNLRKQGRGYAFVIRPLPGQEKFRKVNKHGDDERRAWAICYHGHAEFMRRLFESRPDAVLISRLGAGVIRYDGRADFERRHGAVADVNIGSLAEGEWRSMGDACYCESAPFDGFGSRKAFRTHRALAREVQP